MSASMGEVLWDTWNWMFDRWVEIVLVLSLVAVLGVAFWQIAVTPTCEELGGTLYQVGTHSESYVVSTVKVGEISIPIYGTRTVVDFDCIGER